jgi:hypothetical protein
LYIGQIVHGGFLNSTHATLGVRNIIAATGLADTTTKKGMPIGVVSGLATRSGRTYSSTYQTEYDASVITQAAQLARENIGIEGAISKTDPIAAVQITRIMGTNTVLKGPLYLTTLGVAPTAVTVTTGSSDGLTFIAATSGITTPIAYNATAYCRTGANAGLFRVTSTTGTTTRTLIVAFPYAIAAGDTFIQVPIRLGTCIMQTDALGMFVDAAVSDIGNNYIVNVWDFDLKEAGKENVTFSFTGDHFCAVRA